MKIAIYFSTKNKMISGVEDMKFLGEDKEFLIIYSKEKLRSENLDYFVYGHPQKRLWRLRLDLAQPDSARSGILLLSVFFGSRT